MTTLTAARVTDLPRVNLLPPEVAQAARFRRMQALLGLVVVVALVGVAMAYLAASGQVTAAQDDLDAAQQQSTALKAEAAQYAEVPKVQAELAQGQTDLAVAMAPEVRWSFYLNDLSLSIPSNVRLTTMTVTEPVPAPGADATATTTESGVVSPLGTVGIATITFEGNAVNYDAVASWLQMLAKQKGYTDPTVTQVDDATEDGMTGHVYHFSSSVTVTSEALSGRYTSTAGE